MKRLSLVSLFAFSAFGFAYSQEILEPIMIDEVYLTRINPSGTLAAGQDGGGAMTIGYNIETDELEWYVACYPGDGNCVSDNGIIVGQEMQVDGMYAALMKDGISTVPDALKLGGMSMFNAITPDGSRACGYTTNVSGKGALFIPFYSEITPDGTVLDPVLLPCPEKDFFNNRPQYILAGCISNDGKTIIGLVVDDTGSFSWPIVFREDEEGNWNYTQPTETVFNPDKQEIPQMPDLNSFGIREPMPEDYMTDDQIEEYHKALAQNPDYNQYWSFMSSDAYNKYVNDHIQWADEYADWYYETIGEYQRELNRIGRQQHFGGVLLISPDGKSMITADAGIPYLFNLEDDTFAPLDIESNGITPTQILSDGTLVGCSVVNYSPYQSYICLPGSSEFTPVTDYLAEYRPSDYEWLETTVFNTPSGPITGAVSFSDDMLTICGGYYDGQGGAVSYVFNTLEESGVENLLSEEDNDRFDVYNLQGLRVSGIDSIDDVRNLPKGIYIINGKKIAI